MTFNTSQNPENCQKSMKMQSFAQMTKKWNGHDQVAEIPAEFFSFSFIRNFLKSCMSGKSSAKNTLISLLFEVHSFIPL